MKKVKDSEKIFLLVQTIGMIVLSTFIGYRHGFIVCFVLFLLMVLAVWAFPLAFISMLVDEEKEPYDGEIKLIEFKNGDKNYILSINDYNVITEKDELLIVVKQEVKDDIQNTHYNGQ